MTLKRLRQPVLEAAAHATEAILDQARAISPIVAEATYTCAVPRWLDAGIVEAMAGDAAEHIEGIHLLEHFARLGIAQPHATQTGRWMFLRDIRRVLLKRLDRTARLRALRARAATAFKHRLDARNVQGDERFKDTEWRELAAEWLHQLLAYDTSAGLQATWLICAQAFAVPTTGTRWEVDFCVKLLNALDSPVMSQRVQSSLTELRTGFGDLASFRDSRALPMTARLARVSGLSPAEQAEIDAWTGEVYLFDEGRVAPAVASLKRALRAVPTNARVESDLAAAYGWGGLPSGRMDTAEAHARRAIGLAPRDSSGYLQLGSVYETCEDWKQAEACFEESAARSDVNALWNLSSAQAAQGKIDRALETLDRAIRMRPDLEYDGLVRRARTLSAARRYREAEEAGQAAAHDTPDLVDADLALAELYALRQQSAKAIDRYREAIRKRPDQDAAYVGLAALYQGIGRGDRAVDICEQAIKSGVDTKSIWASLRSAYRARDQLENVEDAQRAIVQFDADERYAGACIVGDLLLERVRQRPGRPDRGELLDRARTYFEQAAILDARRGWAYWGSIEVAAFSGQFDVLASVLASVAKHTPRARYDALVTAGRALLRSRHVQRAHALLQEAAELSPWRQDAWRGIADVFAWRGDAPQASLAWQHLVANNPTLAYDAQISQGEVYESIVDLSRARACYAAAVELVPEEGYPLARLAEIDRYEGLLDDAADKQVRVAQVAPDLAAQAYARIAGIRREQARVDPNRYADAETAARDAIRLDPEQVDGYLELACIGVAQTNDSLVTEARQKLEAALPGAFGYEFDFAVAETHSLEPEAVEPARTAYTACIKRNPHRVEAYIGLSQLLIRQKQLDEAEKLLARARRLEPTNASVWLAVAQLRQAGGDLDGVRAATRRMTRLEPTTQYTACLLIGETLENKREFAAAESVYGEAIKACPWRPDAYVELGALHDGRGRRRLADKVYRQAVAAADISYAALGAYYEQKNRPADALRLYRRGMAAEPTRADPYYAAATLLQQLNNVNGALAALRRMTRQPLLAYEGYVAIGRFHSDRSLRSAVRAYRTALRIDPSRHEAYTGLANVLLQHNRADQATQTLMHGLERASNTGDLCSLLAQVRANQAQFDEAATLFRRAGDQYSDALAGSSAYESAGDLLIQLRRFAEATEALLHAVELKPTNAGAYFSLGFAYEQQNQLDPAVEAYRRALSIAPLYADVYIALGRIYGERGDTQALDSLISRILERLSGRPYDAHMTVAALRREIGDAPGTEDSYRRAIQADADRPETYIALAELLLSQNRSAEAVDLFQQAVTRDPRRAQTYIDLGLAYEQQQQLEEALKAYGQSLEMLTSLADVYDIYIAMGRLYATLRKQRSVTALIRRVRALAVGADQSYELELLVADIYGAAGRLDQAEQALRNAIASHPHRPDAYVRLVASLRDGARADDAIRVCDLMATRRTLAYEAYVLMGDVQADRDQAAALRAYRKARRIDTTRPDAYLGTARALVQGNQVNDAAATLCKALEVASTSADLHAALAQIRADQEQFGEAATQYRCAAEQYLDPGLASRAYEAAGDCLIREGEYGQAVNLLQYALVRNATNAGAYLSLGYTYQAQSQLDQAVQMFGRAITVEPGYFEAYVGLVRVTAEQNNPAALQRATKELLAIDLTAEQRYKALLEIGAAYLAAQSYDDALTYIRRATTERPDRPEAFVQLGYLYEAREQRAAARDAYTHVAEVAPELRAEVAERIAFLFEMDGDSTRAEKAYREATVLAPERSGPYYRLAHLLEAQHRYSEAVQVYQRLATFGPDDATTANLYTAEAYAAQGAYDDMRDACERVVAVVDATTEATTPLLRRKGLAQLYRSEYEAAAETLRAVAKLDPDDAKARMYLALTLMCQGQDEAARAEISRGLEIAHGAADLDPPTAAARLLARQHPDLSGISDIILHALTNPLDTDRAHATRSAAAA